MRRKNNNILNYKREFFGFLFSIFSIFLAISLISYNQTDNSLFYFSTDQKQIMNWCGVLGANLSAFSIYLFGSVAYLFLIFSGFVSYVLIFSKNIRKEILRIFAFAILLICFSTFFRYFNLDFTQSFSGGFVGNSFFKMTCKFFGPVGLGILFLILVWASLMILFRISFVNFFKTIFEFVYKIFKFLVSKFCELIKTIVLKFALLIKNLFVFLFKFFKEKVKLLFNRIKNIKNNRLAQRQQFKNALVIYQENTMQELEQLQKLACKIDNNFVEQEFDQNQEQNLDKDINFISGQDIEQEILQEQKKYNLPNLNMFQETKQDQKNQKELQDESAKRAEKLEEKLRHFGIKGKVTAIKPGPVITLYEYKPEIDSKISKIISLEDDLAMALTALSIRIVAPIPGKNVVGFEIANQKRQNVLLQDIMLSEEFLQSSAKLPLGLGVDVVGKTVIGDLVSMPHLLVAGSTGSGKSVGMNVMLASLLCKLNPEQLKLILIDPKRLEFCPYADIPHLLFPIITNPRSAAPVLKWLVQEMEERYDKMAQNNVKNIIEYNNLAQNSQDLKSMPLIVLMID
ncbi:DNA translocase FtsK 4TM domain-containing protein, partial [Candidatus Babeliales bacterium]|nr:DNA translocase FtsK 4TM domain-containing protein [Candidatus Babeliales bacterium]